MAKVPYAELPVRIFTPLTPGDVCLGLIGDGPVLFKGKTPLAVKQAAEKWRTEELAKLARKMPKGAVQEVDGGSDASTDSNR